MQQTTNVIAGAAVASPWWLPALQNFSEIAALMLPIAGLIWLMVQIITHITKYYKDK